MRDSTKASASVLPLWFARTHSGVSLCVKTRAKSGGVVDEAEEREGGRAPASVPNQT